MAYERLFIATCENIDGSYHSTGDIFSSVVSGGMTLGLFFLMKKKNWKPVTCIALLLVIGLVGAFFGIFA